MAIASARAGNVIGGGDWTPDGLVSDIVKSLLIKQPVVIRNPAATRPWQHVLDALHGYLILAEHLYTQGPEFAQAWNFGPYDASVKPVGWLVEEMLAIWGEDARWELAQGGHFHEHMSLSLDSAKARFNLGWQPRLSLADSLEQIVSWTKAYRSGADMQQVSIETIDRFMKLG